MTVSVNHSLVHCDDKALGEMNYPECTESARHRQDEIVANVTHLPILQSLVLPSVNRVDHWQQRGQ